MSTPRASEPSRRALFGRRNVILLLAALLTLVAGYALLGAGQSGVAAAVLVVGYCLLFPLAIAL